MLRHSTLEWPEAEYSVADVQKRRKPDVLSSLLALGCSPDIVAFGSDSHTKRLRLSEGNESSALTGSVAAPADKSDAAAIARVANLQKTASVLVAEFRWPIMQLPLKHLRRRHLFIVAQKQQLRAAFANPNLHVTRPLTQLAELYQLNLDNENTGVFRARNTTQVRLVTPIRGCVS